MLFGAKRTRTEVLVGPVSYLLTDFGQFAYPFCTSLSASANGNRDVYMKRFMGGEKLNEYNM